MKLIQGESKYLGLKVPKTVTRFLKEYEENRTIDSIRIKIRHLDSWGVGSQGIHLLEPNLSEIGSAISDADIKGFSMIFCYYPEKSKHKPWTPVVHDGGIDWQGLRRSV